MPWRELAFALIGALLSLAGWGLGIVWLAWPPAIVAAIWFALATFLSLTGRKSPL